jgi:hypothetical protein
VQACGIAGDPDSVFISELLPQYASLLNHLDSHHSSKQLTATTAYRQLLALHGFLKTYQELIEDGSVDYAAMLTSIDAARCRFLKRSNIDAKTQVEGESLGSRKRKAAALPAWAAAYRQHKTNTDAAAVAAPAAGAVAGSSRGTNNSVLDLSDSSSSSSQCRTLHLSHRHWQQQRQLQDVHEALLLLLLLCRSSACHTCCSTCGQTLAWGSVVEVSASGSCRIVRLALVVWVWPPFLPHSC